MITMETPFRPSWRYRRRAVPTTTIYRVTDRLHEGRTADVPCHQIVTTVSAWLAESQVKPSPNAPRGDW